MPKTHQDLIIENEDKLRHAMLIPSDRELRLLLDPNIIYVDEFGQSFKGFENIPVRRKNYKLNSIETISRDIFFFNSVAVSTTLEIRNGHNNGYDFITKVCVNRVWKFDGRKWTLINATAVSC